MPFYLVYFICLLSQPGIGMFVKENRGLLSVQSKIIVHKIL